MGYPQGGPAESIFYIRSGRITLVVLSEQGKEAVVWILEPGRFFGEEYLNGQRLRISTTTALEECVITAITKNAMLAALHSKPKLSEPFMSYLLTRNGRLKKI
jgi:CRP/FNR family cyclic AMP-dependent transcriptional regulator